MKGWLRRSEGFTLLSSRGATEGFTLIEIVIVLAIIAVLAGILAPTLTRYVSDAKFRRAEADCQRIAVAIGAFYSDVGEWPIWKDGTNTISGPKAKILEGQSEGTLPTITGAGWPVPSDWSSGSADVDGIVNQLMNNTPGSSTTLRYPTTGKRAWMGPYLEAIKPDPWSSKYVVVTEFLWPQNINGSKPCFVISAGPDKEIDTAYNQTGPDLTVGDDDIAFRIK